MTTISCASIVLSASELFPAITLSAISVESVQKQKNTAQRTKSRKYCVRNDRRDGEEISQLRTVERRHRGEDVIERRRDVLYDSVLLRIDLSLNTNTQASEILNDLGDEE